MPICAYLPAMSTPTLTDRHALALHRNRARRRQGGMADFLHRAVFTEVQQRLIEVNRTFTDIAVVSGFPELWAQFLPEARHVADAAFLDLEEGAHDLVLHALALHWADDPVGQLVQCRRALRPDGLFLGAALGGETLAPLRRVLAQAEAEISGGLSPRVAPMGEIRDLGGLVQRAGFALPVADAAPVAASYATALHLMTDLRAMGETNALATRHRKIPPRALFPRAAALYAESCALAGGRVSASFDVIYLTGWAPGPGQPKALRPGSATERLADALGAEERPLPGPKD
ncbi:MAG: methyltransferase domain-containing protein [Pseudomonadota bacterium]